MIVVKESAPLFQGIKQEGEWQYFVLLIENFESYSTKTGFPSSSDGKASACNAGNTGSGKSPAEGNGNPLQYSFLENSMDRGTWQATVHGVTKSWT